MPTWLVFSVPTTFLQFRMKGEKIYPLSIILSEGDKVNPLFSSNFSPVCMKWKKLYPSYHVMILPNNVQQTLSSLFNFNHQAVTVTISVFLCPLVYKLNMDIIPTFELLNLFLLVFLLSCTKYYSISDHYCLIFFFSFSNWLLIFFSVCVCVVFCFLSTTIFYIIRIGIWKSGFQ